MPKTSLKSIGKEITKAKTILIASHINPDFDATGSSVGLYLILKKLGKNVSIASSFDGYSWDFFKELITDKQYRNYDLAILLDYGQFYRLDKKALKILKDQNIFLITLDHHFLQTQKGDLLLIDTSKSSTSEMVYDLAKAMNWQITKEAALALLTGIYYDTGGFTYERVNKNLFKKVGDLLRDPGMLSKIKSFENNWQNLEQLKLFAKYLKLAKIDKQLSLVYCVIKEEPQGINEKLLSFMHSKLSDSLLEIKDIKISLVLRKLDWKKWKGSLRGASYLNKIDLNKIASYFNGGGHFNASGFESDLNSATIIKKIKELIKEEKPLYD
jgi:phosphoesterase RecJ-like protein